MHSGFESLPPSHHPPNDVDEDAGVDDERVAAHPLLASLTDAERAEALPLVRVHEVPAGGVLTRQGRPGTGLHLVLEGAVRVAARSTGDGQVHELAILGPGSWVGEHSLRRDPTPPDEQPAANADVVALEPTTVGTVAPADGPTLLAIDAVHLQLSLVAGRRHATNRSLEVAPVEIGRVGDRPLVLRPLWPDDWRHLLAGTDRVSEESLRMRFFHPPALTERTFRRLAALDLTDQFAWAALLDGELVAIGRYGRLREDRSHVEVAVLVVDEHQREGIGPKLLAALAVAADLHGATTMYAEARTANVGVRRMLEGVGATFTSGGEEGTVEARWSVADANADPRHAELRAAVRPVAAAVLAEVTDG